MQIMTIFPPTTKKNKAQIVEPHPVMYSGVNLVRLMMLSLFNLRHVRYFKPTTSRRETSHTVQTTALCTKLRQVLRRLCHVRLGDTTKLRQVLRRLCHVRLGDTSHRFEPTRKLLLHAIQLGYLPRLAAFGSSLRSCSKYFLRVR